MQNKSENKVYIRILHQIDADLCCIHLNAHACVRCYVQHVCFYMAHNGVGNVSFVLASNRENLFHFRQTLIDSSQFLWGGKSLKYTRSNNIH